MLVLTFLQDPRKSMEEQNARHGGWYHVGNRLREESCVCGKQGRQQQKSCEKDAFTECRTEQCLTYLSKRGGLIYQRILDRQRNDHGSEPFDISDGSCKDHGISGKQSYIERRNSLCYDCHKDAKDHAQSGDTLNCLFDPVRVTFP